MVLSHMVCPPGLEPGPKASEAFMVSNSTTGTFLYSIILISKNRRISFNNNQYAASRFLPPFFSDLFRRQKCTVIFYSFLLPFCKRLCYTIFKKVKKFFVADPFFLLCGGKGGKFYVENGSSGHERRSGQLGCGASFEMAGL